MLVFFSHDPVHCVRCTDALNVMRRVLAQARRVGAVTNLIRCDLEATTSSQCLPNITPPTSVTASLFKAHGREDYHGALTTRDLTAWFKVSTTSSVISLEPTTLHNAINSPIDSWFINYFRPNCPPCHAMLPRFREAADRAIVEGRHVRFALIDCEQFPDACATQGVDTYPTPIFYNATSSAPHHLDGNFFDIAVDVILEHIEDVRSPPLISITPDDWEHGVIGSLNLYVVAFTAGRRCGACTDAKRELSQVAKSLRDIDVVSIAILDCDTYTEYCGGHHVTEYPDIRLWKAGIKSLSDGGLRFDRGQIWSKHFVAWIASHLPNKVQGLTANTHASLVLGAGTLTSFIVYSCPRWCGPCKQYREDLRMIATILDRRGTLVNVFHIDCDDHPKTCQSQGVRSYPTIRLRLFSGRLFPVNAGQMSPIQTADWIVSHVELPRAVASLQMKLKGYFTQVNPHKSGDGLARIIRRFIRADQEGRDEMAQQLLSKYNTPLVIDDPQNHDEF
jgi:thiol-disulfide isomerase/thioredoxin